MDARTLWLVRGDHEAPGWKRLRKDSRSGVVDVVHLDPLVWAVVWVEEAPGGYEGLEAVAPPDGLYVDPQGNTLYIVGREIVPGPRDVIAALGFPAQGLLAEIGDPDTVLERLGHAY